MANEYDRPLTDEEFVEIGELLASIPEPWESMEPDSKDQLVFLQLSSFSRNPYRQAPGCR